MDVNFHKAAPLLGIIILLLLVMAACTHKIAVPREGRILRGVPAQELAQCKKQPNFPGCEHVGR